MTISTDPVADVLSRLEGVRKTAAGWEARCPAHDDRHPSLNIARGDDGRVLLCCQAGDGCSLSSIVGALGINERDLFPASTSPAKKTKTTKARAPIEAVYPYHDAAGKLVFEVVRCTDKTFPQRRPDGKGGYIWGVNGVQRVLYHLPELLATDPGKLIYVVEGEKDVDRLRSLGLTATTNPGGAEKWKRLDDSPLIDRNVAVIPDNDDKGRRHAQQVAAALHGRARDVAIVDLGELPEKADVSDWLDDGHTFDDLIDAVSRAPSWSPPAPLPGASSVEATSPDADEEHGEDEQDEDEPKRPRADVVRMSDIPLEHIHWLWRNRIALGKLTMFAGIHGLGKSFTTTDIAARISRGHRWPDDCNEPAPLGDVLLLNAEDGPGDTIKPRLRDAGADMDRVHALRSVAEVDGSGRRMFDLGQDILVLDDVLAGLDAPRLVVIDPVTAYLNAKTDAYRDNEVRAVLQPLADLAARRDVAVVCVAHLRKQGSDNALFRVAGSIGFTALARAAWIVVEDRDGDPEVDRLLLPLKMNMGKAAPGLHFSIVDPGVVRWGESTTTRADDALAPRQPERASKTDEAAAWVRSTLADAGGWMRATELREAAEPAGHKWRTVEYARQQGLAVVVRKVAGVEGNPWVWALTIADFDRATADLAQDHKGTPSPCTLAALQPCGGAQDNKNTTPQAKDGPPRARARRRSADPAGAGRRVGPEQVEGATS